MANMGSKELIEAQCGSHLCSGNFFESLKKSLEYIKDHCGSRGSSQGSQGALKTSRLTRGLTRAQVCLVVNYLILKCSQWGSKDSSRVKRSHRAEAQ